MLDAVLTSTGAALTGWTVAALSSAGGCFFTEAAGAASFSGSSPCTAHTDGSEETLGDATSTSKLLIYLARGLLSSLLLLLFLLFTLSCSVNSGLSLLLVVLIVILTNTSKKGSTSCLNWVLCYNGAVVCGHFCKQGGWVGVSAVVCCVNCIHNHRSGLSWCHLVATSRKGSTDNDGIAPS